MLNRRPLGIAFIAFVGLLVPATALALGLHAGHLLVARAAAKAPAKAVPTSSRSSGTAQIGALYRNGSTSMHDCTASVVASPHGNVLLTAAHCVSGDGSGMVFVPGERGGRAPHGRWTVTAAYLPRSWLTRQDPDADVAFLAVAPRTIAGTSTEIQQVTGAYRLGLAARPGERVTVTGYPAGTTNDPITCQVQIYLTHEYPTFDCHGYVGGTSGSPWVLMTAGGPRVVGVIGGRNQGGCVESTSYSSPLNGSLATYRRAVSDAPTDTAPAPHGDGC